MTKLILGDELQLVPYMYEEQTQDDGTLFIIAAVAAEGQEAEKLHRFIKQNKYEGERGDKYFSVVRVGTDKEPNEMRFGRTLWSEDDGRLTQEIVLVEKAQDEAETEIGPIEQFVEPNRSNAEALLAETSSLLEELVAVLESKGVLQHGDAQTIREAAKHTMAEKYLKFSRVSNLDDWVRA